MRGTTTRRLGIALAFVASSLVVLVLVAPPLLREPLARFAEEAANARLRGYRLSVGAVDLEPLALGVRVHDLALQDDDASEPPVLRAPAAEAGIALSGFLRFRTRTTVAEPLVEIDGARLRALREAGLAEQLLRLGSDAVETAGRLRTALGTVRVEGATVRWLAPQGAVTLSDVAVGVENVSAGEAGGADDRYALRFEARAPPSGGVRAEGESALFASAPPPMDVAFRVERLALPAFAPLLAQARLDAERGVVSARGGLRVADRSVRLELAEATLDDAVIDWRHTAPTWAAERQGLEEAAGRARSLLGGWDVAFAAGRVAVRASTFGVRDASADPPYRVFATVESAALHDLDSAPGSGPATIAAQGRPMGTGHFDLDGELHTAAGGPDVHVELRVRDVALPALNEALLAHGAVALASGSFSLALDASVRDGRIAGQVVPLLANVEVREKEDAGLARAVVESAADAVTDLLENERGNIATRTTLSGTLPNPKVGVWEALIGLLRNAFVESIAPEFQRAVGKG
jgi:hypothetical protein